jgi:hypothetical protein
LFGPPVEMDFSRSHAVTVSLGSFPTEANRKQSTPEVAVWLDGSLQWRTAARFYPAESSDVFIGRNPIGGTTCGNAFTGAVLQAKRQAAEPDGTPEHAH